MESGEFGSIPLLFLRKVKIGGTGGAWAGSGGANEVKGIPGKRHPGSRTAGSNEVTVSPVCELSRPEDGAVGRKRRWVLTPISREPPDV